MVETILSILALSISLLSLVLHFFEIRNSQISIHNLEISPLNNFIDLLFVDNNIVNADIANPNNRDILIYLSDGYIDINNQKAKIKPAYFTIQANSITSVKLEIFIDTYEAKKKTHDIMLLFEYTGLLFKRKLKYTR